jgi:hypothetical protein
VCCALFERDGLFFVSCFIVLPLPPGKNPFAIKINNNNKVTNVSMRVQRVPADGSNTFL